MKKLVSGIMLTLLLVSMLTLAFSTQPAVSEGGLVGYWKFDEGSGTAAIDSSGNDNTGTLINEPVWADGKYGKALSFDGVDDHVQVPQSSSLDVTDQITVETWVYPRAYVDNTGMVSHIISRCDYSGDHIYVLSTYPDSNRVSFSINPYSGEHPSVADLPLNAWTHLAMTYDGSHVRLYVNGELDSSYAQSGPIYTTSNWLAFGCKPTGPWGGSGTYAYFSGIIDEVRIYNRALSQQEIQSDMGTRKTIDYSDDFSVDTGVWTYTGTAYRDNVNKYVVLTEAVNAESGAVWFNESLSSSFTVRFRYWVGNSTGTMTDGFVVMFYKQRDDTLPKGGYLGFWGSGYGVEFDTFWNSWDSSGNHVALIKDGVGNHLVQVDDPRVKDNAWHNVAISVTTLSVAVYIDAGKILQWNGTLDLTYDSFGFSAATGEASSPTNDKHIIDDVSIRAPASMFGTSLTPATTNTSIGGVTHCVVAVENQGGMPDLFNISVSGLNSSWLLLSRDSVYLISGEMAQIDLTISIPEDPSAVGTFLFYASVQESLGIEKNVSSQLIVVLNPIISDLEPAHDTTVGSTNALFSWCTSSHASSEVYIKSIGDPTFNQIVGEPGTTHFVCVYNLSRNTDYSWYVHSSTTYGEAGSDLATLHVSNGISFVQDTYTFNVERDYAQLASVSVINTDTESHDLLLQAINPYDDLIVGFVGPGSTDENLTIAPGETRSVAFNIFAQDAMQQNYTFTIKLTNLGPGQITDYALVNVHVRQLNINLTLTEVSTDPVTLSKTIVATNYGDTITDLCIDTGDELNGKVYFQPAVYHAYFPTGGTLTFKVHPVLTSDFAGCEGLVLATCAGQTAAFLQVNFTLPPGKSVFLATIPQVRIEFSQYYDTDDSPNTNPLPGQLVESYLANETIVFACQMIADVYQNNTPAYGANVSLTVWDETGTVWSTKYSETDFTGKAMFMVYGQTGNYSYQAELAGYGTETGKRSFAVDTNPLFEIHPEDITWLDVSDRNSTFDLSQNGSRILLDQAPFTFRAKKTTIDQNATFTLCLTWDLDKFKRIFVRGSILNDTLLFETRGIPTGNFSAAVLYYSNVSGLSLSSPINLTITDWSAMYLQGNYTYWQPFPLNSTDYIRLSISRSVNARDPSVAFDLHGIQPDGDNSLYRFTYFSVSNVTVNKEFHVTVQDFNTLLYNNTFSLSLEPWKPVLVNFTIPAYYDNGTLRPQLNATISSGSLFVTVLLQTSIHYIYDSGIWVGAQWGFLGDILEALLPPPPSQPPESYSAVALSCGKVLLSDFSEITSGDILGSEISRIGFDALDYALHADELKLLREAKRYVVGGVGFTIGVAIGGGTSWGSPLGPLGWVKGMIDGGEQGYVIAATTYDAAACQIDWLSVQDQATPESVGIGQSEVFGTSSWYCTNRPEVSTTVTISSCVSRTASPDLNVDPAALIVRFALPWPKETYRNHNIHLLINNVEIGNLTNTIPEGYYIFPFNASILNYASEGTAQNMVTLRMENLNGGHYVVSTDMEIVLHLKKLRLAVVASNQTEANSIVQQLSGTVASLPDFGLCQQDVFFSDPQPLQGEDTTIAANIFNFGTVGMLNVPVDLYIDSNKVATTTVSFIPALTKQTIGFDWTAARGTHNITIVVNGAQKIPESDYSNNQVQTSITVLADDVAIANATHTKNAVGQGFSFNVSSTAANSGDFTETFNVTVYANTTIIASQNVTLSAGNSISVTFAWNTTGFAKGNYTISVYAWPVQGETCTSDNTFIGGWVYVTIPGDLNADRVVDVFDAVILASHAGHRPPDVHPLGTPDCTACLNADINGDGVIDIFDAVILVGHAGEHYP